MVVPPRPRQPDRRTDPRILRPGRPVRSGRAHRAAPPRRPAGRPPGDVGRGPARRSPGRGRRRSGRRSPGHRRSLQGAGAGNLAAVPPACGGRGPGRAQRRPRRRRARRSGRLGRAPGTQPQPGRAALREGKAALLDPPPAAQAPAAGEKPQDGPREDGGHAGERLGPCPARHGVRRCPADPAAPPRPHVQGDQRPGGGSPPRPSTGRPRPPGQRNDPPIVSGSRRVGLYRRAVPFPLGDVSGGRSAATPFRSSPRRGGRRRGRSPRGRRRAPGRRWPPACRRTSLGRGPWR